MSTEKTEIVAAKVPPSELSLMDPKHYDQLWRVAQMFAATTLVPEHFRGKPENCFVACNMAMRANLEPFMVLQKAYVIKGKLGLEAQLLIAMLNKSGKIKGRIQFELSGEGGGRQCRAYCVDRESGAEQSQTVTMVMAQAEGWIGKDGSKWRTLPDHMLQLRSATFLIRMCYPEVVMGLSAVDELQDTEEAESRPAPVIKPSRVEAIVANAKASKAESDKWPIPKNVSDNTRLGGDATYESGKAAVNASFGKAADVESKTPVAAGSSTPAATKVSPRAKSMQAKAKELRECLGKSDIEVVAELRHRYGVDSIDELDFEQAGDYAKFVKAEIDMLNARDME